MLGMCCLMTGKTGRNRYNLTPALSDMEERQIISIGLILSLVNIVSLFLVWLYGDVSGAANDGSNSGLSLLSTPLWYLPGLVLLGTLLVIIGYCISWKGGLLRPAKLSIVAGLAASLVGALLFLAITSYLIIGDDTGIGAGPFVSLWATIAGAILIYFARPSPQP